MKNGLTWTDEMRAEARRYAEEHTYDAATGKRVIVSLYVIKKRGGGAPMYARPRAVDSKDPTSYTHGLQFAAVFKDRATADRFVTPQSVVLDVADCFTHQAEGREVDLCGTVALATTQDVTTALTTARRYGGTDGDHHRAWVIDQMVRALTGENYDAWIRKVKSGGDGPDTFTWDVGIAP